MLEEARAVLKRHYGYDDFRPGQQEAVECAITGQDALVLMPTGGGKSICFQIPSQMLPGATIVVSPLISLMKDQVDNANNVGIAATFVNSTLPAAEISARLESVAHGAVKLLYIAPERFDSPAFRDRLKEITVSFLAIDEAHCVSAWGHDFRPSYAQLGKLREQFAAPVVALTATATPEVRGDIIRMLALRDPVVIARGFDRPNLSWGVIQTKTDAEKDRLFIDMLRAPRTGMALAYAATRRRVESLSDLLNSQGIRSVAYHAGLSSADRQRLQEGFVAGTAGVVVATNAFGMGIDQPNVRLVLHYDYPGSIEAYYQEAGRAGRDRQPAECVVLCGERDHRTHEFLLEQAHPSADVVRRIYETVTRTSANQGAASAAIARSVGAGCSAAQVDAALRVLLRLEILRTNTRRVGEPYIRFVASEPIVLRAAGSDLLRLLLGQLISGHGNAALHRGVFYSWRDVPRVGSAEQLTRELGELAARGVVEWRPAREERSIEWLRTPRSGDWADIQQQREREQRRLHSMRAYTSTEGCRRAFLLGYFGERTGSEWCPSCDNCRRAATPATPRWRRWWAHGRPA